MLCIYAKDVKRVQGLGWGESYINPPKGPPLSEYLEYIFSGLEPPYYWRVT